MLMPKRNRVAIYENLFKEGVLVAKKDWYAPKHGELEVPNLQVIMAMKSLRSRNYVREQFSWRHYYWYLTNEGIQYLREYLHLPPEIVPATLKRQARAETARPRPTKDMAPRGPAAGDTQRDAYRRGPPGAGGQDKKGDVGAGPSPQFEFRGGFGRGNPPPQ
ncbi:40S ribosomal protein S10-like [Patiria miniata]|uniref:Plectin/eS10 N-terminal domain-containing protein n=1 Tax=Patiria miniata TaxID=46514 RepID=A0A913ZMK4_PATMI|nr:40S ribosomal protein S10-like [Patiria miniata]